MLRISKEDFKEVLERHAYSRVKTAAELECCTNTVIKYARLYEIGPHTIDLRKPFDVQEAHNLYASGFLTLTGLGRRYGVDSTQVRNALIKKVGPEEYKELVKLSRKARREAKSRYESSDMAQELQTLV